MPAVKEIDAETKGKIRPAKDKPRQINSGGYYFIAANIFRRRDLLFLAAFISAAINLCLRFILFRLAVFNLPARFRSQVASLFFFHHFVGIETSAFYFGPKDERWKIE